MSLDGICDLTRDCESTTYRSGNPENSETRDHVQLSDDCSVTYDEDQNSIVFQVKEFEHVESGILRKNSKHEMGSASTASSTTQMKSSLGQGIEESNDGFQTPTSFPDNLSSSGLKCPPAPRKPKAEPLGRRKRERKNLQVEFMNEVEMVLRLLSGGNQKLKKARLVAPSEILGHES